MQIFTALMNKALESKRITPFRCKNLNFTHALFADDAIVAIRANARSIRSLVRILEHFYSMTGLRINQVGHLLF